MKVLHIGHSAKWRGGENQARLLIEVAVQQTPECKHYLAYPKGAMIFERLRGISAGNLSLPSKKAFDFRSVFALIKFCKANHIDILHAHSATAHTLALLTKKFLPKLKLVVHRRVDNPIKTRRSTRAKYVSLQVDKFICVSQAIADILIDYGVAQGKIELIYDSIDASVYQNKDRQTAKTDLVTAQGWDQNVPLIGFISAIDHQKNPELFVDIVKGVLARGVEVNAVMAGDGKLLDTIWAQIASDGLANNLRLLGFVKDVARLFPALDIFILPSRNEGLGTVMLEAIAAKTVVVAADVGGIGEVILDLKTGRLIEAANVEGYVDAVIALLGDGEQRTLLATNALHHIDGKFDLNTMVRSTLSVYQQLMEG